MKKKKGRFKYAFIGAEKGIGDTYLAISFSIYLSYACKERVALIECNKSGHLNSIKEAAEIVSKDSCFSLAGIDWYPHANNSIWTTFNQSIYDSIIIDYGEFNQKRLEEYIKCDYYFFVGSLCEWKRKSYMRIIKAYELCKKQAVVLANLAKEYDIRLFYKEYHIRLIAVPCIYDPFVLDKKTRIFWDSIEKRWINMN